MLSCPSPNEEARLRALHAFQVLDTEPEEAFEGITRLAKSALQVPIALVSLVDRDRQWFKARIGLEAQETSREVSFCARAIEQRDPLIVPDARCDPRFADSALVTGEPYIRFYMGAQIRTRDGFDLGTVCCIDTVPRTPSEDQIAVLRDLARLAMDELELRQLLAADSLTGALTRRAFLNAGRRDFALAHRNRRPLACVMADVDHFKRINDVYGHAMGDQVLRRLVALLRGELRASDYVGRLGGEEFALVLRDTGQDEAWGIADRLRGLLAAQIFPTLGGPLAVTISCGVADYAYAASFDALCEQADAALYEAKNGGRNRTVAYRRLPTPRDAARSEAPREPTEPRDPPIQTAAHALNLPAYFLQHGDRRACTVVSHFNGVVQVEAAGPPEPARGGRVSVHSDVFGVLEGEALWLDERRFALALVASAPKRAWLSRAFARLSQTDVAGQAAAE